MESIYYNDLTTRVESFASREETHTLFDDRRVNTSIMYELSEDEKRFSVKRLNKSW